MSLYQSYRPRIFSDVVGQDLVKKILSNSCKTQVFHHGYIFFGFHGIGKTTLARIFAQALNCTQITSEWSPCHTCINCQAYDAGRMIDVIEIDAASYTGVDNIREVIEHAQFTPTQGKYKVYIIDEVHMLSKGAFNALLKTLEEPPAHAIFLLATTEIHKIPDTILSRVIRFDLTKISPTHMKTHLLDICTREWITTSEEAINILVHRSRGSLRDALTMLEKCIIEKTLSLENVEQALHLVHHTFLEKTFHALLRREADTIQEVITVLEWENTDVRQFASQMCEWIVEHIDDAFSSKNFPKYKHLFDLFTRIFIQSKQVAVPLDILKMTMFECIQTGTLCAPLTHSPSTPPSLPSATTLLQEPEEALLPSVTHTLPLPSHELPLSTSTASHVDVRASFSVNAFLEKIKELGIKSTLIPLLSTAHIEIIDNTLAIKTTPFAQGRCEDPNVKGILFSGAQFFGANGISISAETTTQETQKIEAPDLARDIFNT